MATTNQANRAYPKTITLKVGNGNNGAANAATAKIPLSSIITGVSAASVTAFNGSGTVTLTAKEGSTTFVNAQNVKDAVGIETAAATAKALPNGGTVSVYIEDGNSNSTAGEAWVTFTYVETNGSNEVYG